MNIEGGTCTCILGPSGCGKSTLLKIISGNRSIEYQGAIRFSTAAGIPNQTAWMSQNDLLLPWMSVEDNVLLGAKLRFKLTASLKEQGTRLLAEAGLTAYAKSLPSELSGGMRQRVSLLRTLMEDRPVLLMDEPFSALDALTRIRLQDLSAELTRGTTTLLVTHDAAEALRMAHRIIILGGTPAQVKTTLDFHTQPPRGPDSEEVLEHYSSLLALLLEDHD